MFTIRPYNATGSPKAKNGRQEILQLEVPDVSILDENYLMMSQGFPSPLYDSKMRL